MHFIDEWHCPPHLELCLTYEANIYQKMIPMRL